MPTDPKLQRATSAGNAAELLASLEGVDRRRVAGVLLALASSLLEEDVAADAAAVDLVREGVRRGLWPSTTVGTAHAREGRLPGCAKVGRRWLGPASALDAFVTAHGRAPAPRAPTPANDAAPRDELLEATRAAARRGRR